MTDDDDDGRRIPKRPDNRRVTLSFQGPPLALPEHKGDEDDDDGVSEPPVMPAKPPTPSQAPPGPHDGWVRDKISRGNSVQSLQAAPKEPSPEPGPPITQTLPPPPPLPWSDEETTDAFSLVERERRPSRSFDLVAEMRERFELGDFTAALRAAELLLGRTPDHEEARRTAELARAKLEELYLSRLGGARGAPVVTVPEAEIRWLGLDNQAASMLSRIDGYRTLDELVDESGMNRVEALKALAALVAAKAITVR